MINFIIGLLLGIVIAATLTGLMFMVILDDIERNYRNGKSK